MTETRRASGKVGRYIYVIVDMTGRSRFFGLAKWEVRYMMRENNGPSRGWRVFRYTREALAARKP